MWWSWSINIKSRTLYNLNHHHNIPLVHILHKSCRDSKSNKFYALFFSRKENENEYWNQIPPTQNISRAHKLTYNRKRRPSQMMLNLIQFLCEFLPRWCCFCSRFFLYYFLYSTRRNRRNVYERAEGRGQ